MAIRLMARKKKKKKKKEKKRERKNGNLLVSLTTRASTYWRDHAISKQRKIVRDNKGEKDRRRRRRKKEEEEEDGTEQLHRHKKIDRD